MTQPIQPDQATFLLQTVLPILEREHRTTKAVVEALPTSKWDYRCDPNSRTALELAWHIVAAEKRFLEGVVNGQFNFDPIHRPESAQTSADIGRWYEEMFQSVFARLQKLSGDQLIKSVDFRGMFQQPAVMYCLLASFQPICGPAAPRFRPFMARATTLPKPERRNRQRVRKKQGIGNRE